MKKEANTNIPGAPAGKAPAAAHRAFDKSLYEGGLPSNLCMGCGHDQISRHIVKAFYESGVDPFQIVKISGIGCSSKTPNWFLKAAKGFNGIHGRAASIATGVKIANRALKALCVSGDGDTGSIGLGAFLHTVRKNIPLIYIVENNGLYGLTKGQFSVTAEKSSRLKRRGVSLFPAMDLCRLALNAGCGFVARSFSGDAPQMKSILKSALRYEGFAFIDVISPCVAYGNEKDFPHSFFAMKEDGRPLHELDLITPEEPVTAEIPEGQAQKIPLAKGGFLVLKKLGQKDHDPTEKAEAWRVLEAFSHKKESPTGLIYYKEREAFFDKAELSTRPLVSMKDEEIRPPPALLDRILSDYR